MKWKVKKIIDLQGITVKAGYFVICPSCELKQMFASKERCYCYNCKKRMSLDELLRLVEEDWLQRKVTYTDKMRRRR